MCNNNVKYTGGAVDFVTNLRRWQNYLIESCWISFESQLNLSVLYQTVDHAAEYILNHLTGLNTPP